MLIAECGQNFQGNMNLARRMIELAKDNGADLVKFQLYDTDMLYEKGTENYKLAKEAELSYEQAVDLFQYGGLNDIEVFFSVFDPLRVEWCERIGVKRYKIACSKRDDRCLLGIVEETHKPIIISLPFNSLETLYPSYFWHEEKYNCLCCIPKYPASIGEIEFKKTPFEPELFGRFQGFSDHTIGLDAAKIALARGAKIIEKHFAIDHRTGVDAPWSMTPDELKELKEWEEKVELVIQ